MKKDFKYWHDRKTLVEEKNFRLFFHEREIWWCRLGVNVGFEQDGKGENFARPVLIFKKFNNEIFWALPLTGRTRSGKFFAPVYLGDGMNRSVILSQLRWIDAKRLEDKIDTISQSNFLTIKKAVTQLIIE